MKRIILTPLLLLAALTANAEILGNKNIEMSIHNIQPMNNEVSPANEYIVTLGGDRFNVWGSYASFGHRMMTQSMGDVAVLGIGGGFSETITPRLSLYGHLGIGFTQTDYRERVEREAVYYKFVGEGFGHPLFIENKGNFWELDYKNELDDYGLLARVGVEYRATEKLYLDLGYYFFQVEHYFSNWNPDLNGGFDRENPDACGCLWEGTQKVDFSGPRIGVKWKF